MLVSAPTDTTSHASFTFVETLPSLFACNERVFNSPGGQDQKRKLTTSNREPQSLPAVRSQITVVMGTSGMWTLFGAAA